MQEAGDPQMTETIPVIKELGIWWADTYINNHLPEKSLTVGERGQDVFHQEKEFLFDWVRENPKCILSNSSDVVDRYRNFIWFVYYLLIYSTHLLSSCC